MRAIGVVAAILAVVVRATPAGAAEITVLSTPSMQGVLNDLAPAFTRATGHTLGLTFEGVPALKRRIEAGDTFDAAVLLPAAVDDLTKSGKIAVGSRSDIARTAAGVAVRAGVPKPLVGTGEDLKRTLLAARAISYSPDSASGSYFLHLLDRLGIETEVKPRLLAVTGRSPVEAVARGEAELTVITVPNIVGVESVALAGLLPEELQNYTTFSIAVSANAKEPKAAEQLIAFLRSPAAAVAIRSKGLAPIVP
ncbi:MULTISPECIES: substrate-binding domain-containing protein [Bradyrhizobium]|uniref:molybdate ABC transporter substrate-binding protein n=1 Tax=Bradyrhizobium TaxID=374 RepID=UPI0004B86758|nr:MULTISPECIES: substrate-binding domain-containing protein [Bradyrhizobium]MBR0944402.1 substrate-binding domain-containing protein [Bradyrhizobium liaoningense]MBR1030726.1 substrate-binding domain-containing protein [Bradyrhizobium liaoningense]MDI2074278.1 substrate-binding domain-containing protein [Bradyrhizobium sp. Mp27]